MHEAERRAYRLRPSSSAGADSERVKAGAGQFPTSFPPRSKTHAHALPDGCGKSRHSVPYALHDYEIEMIRYGFDALGASLQGPDNRRVAA